MTMTMAEAYDVIKLVRRHGVKLCVDYNRRFSPAMINMKNAYHAHKANPQGAPRVYLQEPNRPMWAKSVRRCLPFGSTTRAAPTAEFTSIGKKAADRSSARAATGSI